MKEIISNLKSEFPDEIQTLIKVSEDVINHPMFKKLNNIYNIKKYSEFQIWCVWDFMSILKQVQNFIFCNDILWLPPENPNAGAAFYRLIESEETDLGFKGGDLNRASHFQSFRAAMQELNADTKNIDNFLELIKTGKTLPEALNKSGASPQTKSFLLTNNHLIKQSPYNAIALITLTRENFLPAVFKSLLSYVNENEKIELFVWYHKRHIYLDSVLHGPLSIQIFNEYFTNKLLIKQSIIASIESLKARNELLNEINEQLN